MMKNATILARILAIVTVRETKATGTVTAKDTAAATAGTARGTATATVAPSTRQGRTEPPLASCPFSAMLISDGETENLLSRWYPRFARIPVPELAGARRAWRGPLQPLVIAGEVNTIISDLEANATVHFLDGGILHHDPECRRHHSDLWYAGQLRRMDVRFEIVLVDFGPDPHPQVFSVRPEISTRTYPTHPHLRLDKIARIDSKELPALCTYFTTDGSLPQGNLMLARALDFASIYLAKHLVWLRTATLMAFRPGCPPQEIARDSGLALHSPFCNGNPNPRWVGHWPGPVTPHGAAEMLKAIHPSAECSCGSRKAYRQCCRSAHEAARRHAAEVTSRQVLAQLYVNPARKGEHR
ncbi:MAG: hypothetical protein AAB403_02470 [Planctomycetota bacterium]